MTSNPDVPPFAGYVETTINALRLIHAARQGVIPRITRRLNDSERRTMIKSGAVFVFSVEESGIKRWTDGLLWSPSRIVGNFLVYREINERTSSRSNPRKPYPPETSSRGLSARRGSPDQVSIAFKGPGHILQTHGTNDHGTFKLDGLIKKTITVTIEGSDLHLISYYTSEDIRLGKLKRPSSRPDIMGLYMPPHIFRLTNFRVPPKVEIGPDGKPRLICEPEDLDHAIECKVEESAYQTSDSVSWSTEHIETSPQVENTFATSPVYHGSPNHSESSTQYLRDSTTNRWPVPLDGLRITSLTRQDISWSPSPSPTHPHALSRRRESDVPSPGSWSSAHSQSSRWRGESYDSSSSGNVTLDRGSRIRSNTLYESPDTIPHRRGSDGISGYRLPTESEAARGPGPSSPRLPWMPREASIGDKRTRSSQSAFSYPPASHPSLFPSPHSHHHRAAHPYGSSWGPDTSMNDSSLQQIPAHSLYDTSYTSSSPEDFSIAKVEDFTDS